MKAAVELRPELGGRNLNARKESSSSRSTKTTALSTLTCPRRELIAVTEKAITEYRMLLHGICRIRSGIDADQVAEVKVC